MEILLNLKHHETYGNFIPDEQLKPLLDKYATDPSEANLEAVRNHILEGTRFILDDHHQAIGELVEQYESSSNPTLDRIDTKNKIKMARQVMIKDLMGYLIGLLIAYNFFPSLVSGMLAAAGLVIILLVIRFFTAKALIKEFIKNNRN